MSKNKENGENNSEFYFSHSLATKLQGRQNLVQGRIRLQPQEYIEVFRGLKSDPDPGEITKFHGAGEEIGENNSFRSGTYLLLASRTEGGGTASQFQGVDSSATNITWLIFSLVDL